MSAEVENAVAGAGAARNPVALAAVEPLLDAKGAAALLNVPASWVLAEARADRIPHVRLGRYVRFDAAELQIWWQSRRRGPWRPRDVQPRSIRAARQRQGYVRNSPGNGQTALLRHAQRARSLPFAVDSTVAPARRSYGTGSLYVRVDSAGRESWYGKWHTNGRRVKRKVRTQSARRRPRRAHPRPSRGELRRLMAEVQVTPAVGGHLTVAAAGDALPAAPPARRPEALDRRRCRVRAARATRTVLRRQGARRDPTRGRRRPGGGARGARAVAEVDSQLRRNALGAVQLREGPAAPMGRREPVRGRRAARRARVATRSGSSTRPNGRRVLRHVQSGPYEAIDRAFYLTAIMAGLRHGELIALRWRDVDWVAGRIRVRQNWVLGEFDTPKSRRGSSQRADGGPARRRARPALQGRRASPDDDALVFPDPITGGPLDKAANLRRYRKVLKAAALDATHNLHGLRHSFGTRMAAARRADADAAGVDGAPRHPDDAALRGLRAERARVGAGRAALGSPWSRSWSRSERISEQLRRPE